MKACNAAAPAPRPLVDLLDQTDRAFLIEGYRDLLPAAAGLEPRLERAVEVALDSPGNLVRAQLAFALMDSRGVARARAREVAIGLEYFHTASLLFDDLPSMDDARERRGRLCSHVLHGEATAILAALAFVNQAYALLWGVLGDLPAARRERARQLIADSLGLAGMLNGQALDLAFGDSSRRTARESLRVADGKTVALVRLALVLPAIVGGADSRTLRLLDRLSVVWGRCYQILDDFQDCDLSTLQSGKTSARDRLLGRSNTVLSGGRFQALRRVDTLLERGRRILAELEAGRSCGALERFRRRLEDESDAVRRRAAPALVRRG